jgi:hypothetical protein
MLSDESLPLGTSIVEALAHQLNAVQKTSGLQGTTVTVMAPTASAEQQVTNVRFGSLADIASRPRHVRYFPQSRHLSARFAH